MNGRFDCGTGLGCGFRPCICVVPLRRPFFEVALAVVEGRGDFNDAVTFRFDAEAAARALTAYMCERCWSRLARADYRWCRRCLRSHAGFGQ